MAQRVRRCQDDDRAARPPDPPLRHRRDRQRQLALQKPRRRSRSPRSHRLRNPGQLRRCERYRQNPSPQGVKIGRRCGVKFERRLTHRRTPRGSLFVKYFVTLLIAVVTPLLLGAASEAWFGYRGQRAALNELLQAESRSATERIQTFIDGIRDQLGWVVQLPWMVGDEERHRIDALRLLRQVPAISSITLVDELDRERAFISRQDVNRIGLGASMASDPAVKGAHANKVWFGPVR